MDDWYIIFIAIFTFILVVTAVYVGNILSWYTIGDKDCKTYCDKCKYKITKKTYVTFD